MPHQKQNIVYHQGKFVASTDTLEHVNVQLASEVLTAFEGIRAYKTHNATRIFRAKEHFERLKNSCASAGIVFTWTVNDLISESYKLLNLNHHKDAYLTVMVQGDEHNSSISIISKEWISDIAGKPLRMGISTFERPSPRNTIIDAKLTGNQTHSCLANREVKAKGYDEAILLDFYGYVAQAANANIFIEKDGKLYTPRVGSIMPGITRKTVIELSNMLDIPVIEKDITVEELQTAESAFLCGTKTEITPINSIDEIVFSQKWHNTLGANIQGAYKNLVLEKINYEVII